MLLFSVRPTDGVDRMVQGRQQLEMLDVGCCILARVDIGVLQPRADNSTLDEVEPVAYKVEATRSLVNASPVHPPSAPPPRRSGRRLPIDSSLITVTTQMYKVKLKRSETIGADMTTTRNSAVVTFNVRLRR
ncbi:hypothetical protein EVAR_59115_1 [Eumeta japonica]|uniref:Uncharacterized protein n=1 Tax=Eumeta variegata TaxID=151549 RepID=A0A4C1ZJY1_EUMVA|nr:hypothetical protein EVAR_59115_1 [Eumeta japonica]